MKIISVGRKQHLFHGGACRFFGVRGRETTVGPFSLEWEAMKFVGMLRGWREAAIFGGSQRVISGVKKGK